MKKELESLRPLLAQAAQSAYDNWHGHDGGACGRIAHALAAVINQEYPLYHADVFSRREEGHDLVVVGDYEVDIPYNLYEFNFDEEDRTAWAKLPGVKFKPEDITIEKGG